MPGSNRHLDREGKRLGIFKNSYHTIGRFCYGYTYDEGPGYCRTNFAGKFDKDNQQLKGKGVSFIARSIDHVLAGYRLNYSKAGDNEYLEGNVAAKGAGAAILALGMPSFAELKKITSRIDTTQFMVDKISAFENRNQVNNAPLPGAQKKELPLLKKSDSAIKIATPSVPGNLLDVKKERTSKMVSTIYTNADTIQVMLYDNGVVDDDTVTVFFDNEVVLDRYRITEQAKELNLPLIKNGQPHAIELFANNLGTIPPNTALIIIIADGKRYEVHASYDLSTNAKIIFQHKE